MAIAGELRQSTAVTIKFGPFLDETDGKTAETGLTVSQADVRLSKNGGNMAQKNESTSLTHDEVGMYDCPLNTTDTDTLGILTVNVHESGALPVRQDYAVLPAAVWDAKYVDKTRNSTAQAGAAGTITLDAGASASDDYYNGMWVAIVAGTGSGQVRKIADYVGSTKVATISPNWATNPDNTSVFAVFF